MLGSLGCVQVLGLHDRANGANKSDGGASLEAGESVEIDASDAGAEASPNVVVSGTCGPLHHSSASCAACMDQNCCADATACGVDEACQEATDCLANCTNATCRARCGTFYTHPDTLLALRACRLNQCAAQCGSSCGEFATSNHGCQACRESACCAEATACAKTVACAKLDLCQSNCAGAPNCPLDCNSQYPEATNDYAAWTECANQQCAAQCQTGQDWACLESPILWPRPRATGTIAFSVTLVDLFSETPYAGASVKACDKLDFQCILPQSSATSDDMGRVDLTLSGGLNGFDGYLDITGGRNESGNPIYPAIWYPEPTVIADGWRGTFQFISVDEFSVLGAVTQTTIDPLRGHFAANAADCDFSGASTVSFSVDTQDLETRPFYFVNGAPATTATATDRSAIGGFVNLPAGAEDGGVGGRLVLVTAKSGAAGGKPLGSLSVIIRPGRFTTTSFPPQP
jgi:hypothetical protein